MKKSTLYFSLAIAIMFICALYQPLIGSVYLDKDGKPADLISKIWMQFFDVQTIETIPDQIKHLKIYGDGNHSTMIIYSQVDSTHINSDKLNKIEKIVVKDTLILKVRDIHIFGVYIKGNLSSITLNNVKTNWNLKQMDSMTIIAENGTHVNNHFTDTLNLKKLSLQIKDRSTFTVMPLKADKINAHIEDGALYYNSGLSTDSLIVNLVGKSVVRCEQPNEMQYVKNLIISGNKQYYKDHFTNKNVNVTLQ